MRVSAEGKEGRIQLWHDLSKSAHPVLTSNSIVSLSESAISRVYYGKQEEIGCSEKGPNV